MKIGRNVIVAVGILLAAVSMVTAQEEKWSFEVVPYFWAAGVEGDVTIGGNKVDVDVGFDDIFDSMDAGGGLMIVGQYSRFVIWGQFDYLGLDTDQLDPAPAGGSIQTDVFLGALAAGVQFNGPFKGSTIDVLGGVRYATIDNDLTITGVGSASESQDILDGIVVVRPTFRLSEKWKLNSTLAIGAGDSDLTWELAPTLVYQVSDSFGLRLGYRRVYYDVEGERGNKFDAAFQGLIIGAGFTF
jgi:hypothetical protein